MKKCNLCGKIYSDMVQICPCCGSDLETQMVQQKNIAVETGTSDRIDQATIQQMAGIVSVTSDAKSPSVSWEEATNTTMVTYAKRNLFPPTPEDEFEISDIGYECGIRRYTGKRPIVVIPSVIRGHQVVAIEKGAFWGRKSGYVFTGGNLFVETVIIPDTIRKIGDRAFMNCHNLKTVIAHPGITEIGAQAFFNCPLHMLDFGIAPWQPSVAYFPPETKSIGSFAFSRSQSTWTGGTVPFQEVWLNRKTKLKAFLRIGKAFSRKYCAIYYYKR